VALTLFGENMAANSGCQATPKRFPHRFPADSLLAFPAEFSTLASCVAVRRRDF
jgi:hypothetical protein